MISGYLSSQNIVRRITCNLPEPPNEILGESETNAISSNKFTFIKRMNKAINSCKRLQWFQDDNIISYDQITIVNLSLGIFFILLIIIVFIIFVYINYV